MRSRAIRADRCDAVRALRALWGALLLVEPGLVLRVLPHQSLDSAAVGFARALGARHLAQAAVADTRRGSSRRWVLAGAAVDATHASTMLALAGVREARRPDRGDASAGDLRHPLSSTLLVGG